MWWCWGNSGVYEAERCISTVFTVFVNLQFNSFFMRKLKHRLFPLHTNTVKNMEGWTSSDPSSPYHYRLVGLVVKVSTSGAEDPGSESHLRQDFPRMGHTNDLKIGTPVATLPRAWHHRVSAGTGQPSVSILWLGEVESLICNFYLCVAARKIVWADLSLRYTSTLLGR